MTHRELNICRHESQRLWLPGWWLLLDTEVCLRECNGIGAKWMGFMCKVLNCLMPTFVTASAIHDMRYWKNEGDRHQWDDEFESSCKTIARDKYRWYNPLRYICFFVAHKLRIALELGGELAWNLAGKRFQGDNNG